MTNLAREPDPRDSARAVLDFWFGATPFKPRREWFVKDKAFDQRIRAQFEPLVERALNGSLSLGRDPEDRLAMIVLLDQFPRNLYRGQARAFAGDARARELALALIDGGEHLRLPPLQRWFVYLPLEHAEDLALQERCVELFRTLASEEPTMADALDYAERHRDVIRRFGRFPHRNAALLREDTPAEAEYLAQPGAGF